VNAGALPSSLIIFARGIGRDVLPSKKESTPIS
jgi:hypothetical protein